MSRTQLYRRAFALALVVLGVAALVVGRLAYLQLSRTEAVSAEGRATLDERLLPERGSIYDCQGYLLAVATTVYDIGATPRIITDTHMVADRLAPLLGEPRDRLLALLQDEGSYVLLKRGAPNDAGRAILSWGLSGLQAEARPSREYPHHGLAAPVLGFVTEAGQAAYGLEAYYDEILAGKSGQRVVGSDVLGSLRYEFHVPEDGAELHLTLNINVQYLVENALSRAVLANKAQRGTVIVMEPATGGILAMAVYPSYDPNTREVQDQRLFVNAAISDPYEPGSVFKVMTIASALDAGTITPDTTYYDSGQIVVGGRVIRNADGAAHGETAVPDLLANSLNVGAAHVSTKLGAIKFYDYVRRFGYGQLTGIDLADEVEGWVRVPGDREWHESDLGTNSFGQGLAATPLQVLRAVCAVANDGVLMRPRIVERIVSGDRVSEVSPQPMGRVVSAQAAAQVTEMLVYAVERTLNAAAIAGYSVAGKSGTSQAPGPGGYDPQDTIASFAGYAPAGDPRFAILVVLDRPQEEHWGIRAAAPVFKEIAEQLLCQMGVAPDSVRATLR